MNEHKTARSGGEGTGHHFHGIVEGLKVAWPDEACARDNCGEPLLVLDPVTARDTIARVLREVDDAVLVATNFERICASYDEQADAILAALASQERGDG